MACVCGVAEKKTKNYTKRARFTVKINREQVKSLTGERGTFFFFFNPVYSQKKRHIFLLK